MSDPNGRSSRTTTHSRPVLVFPVPGRRVPGRWCRRHAAPARRGRGGRWPRPRDPAGIPIGQPSRPRSSGRVRRLRGHRCRPGGCSGVWSQNFATRTCASRPGPGRPRSIGRLGIGGCTIVSQARQLSFGRMWRITLKLEGTYSSTSRSSWPMRLSTVPPQPGQVQAASWVMVSRGKCGGSGLRTGCWRSRRLTGCPASASPAVSRASTAPASASGSSPISNSSCSIAWSSFSEEQPEARAA